MIRKFSALLMGAVCACPLGAQSIGASLSGLVEDSQKRVIQNASVSVRDVNTGRELKLQSDADGRFHASGLPPGEYEVEVASPGFAPLHFESVKLAIGESRTLRATLYPELSRQEVTVSAEAVTAVSSSDSHAGKSYGPALMSDLPMISGGQGRNFKTQAYLTPGVAPSTEAHRPFSVAGARNRNNNYLIDSNDYNEIEGGMMMGRGISEQLIPSESIEGMQVLTHNFKAEYGRQNGSIISLVSKRGSNEFHGLFYEYLRNDGFNARNTFDWTTPPLKYNHFGVNAGGPIVKDKLFFFGNYEGALQRSGSARTIQTLNTDQRARAVPAIQPLVSMYPEPNIPGTNLFRANVNQTASLNTFLIRADYNASERHRIFSRSTFLTTDTDIFAGAAVSHGRRKIGSQGHSLHHTWSPRASVLNEARFNFTRFRIGDGFVDPVQLGNPEVNGEVGSVFVNGLTFLGHYSWYGQRNYQNNFQWSDDLSVVSGRHAWKMGVAVRRLQLNNGTISTGYTGQMRFNNVNEFLAGSAASYNRNIGNPYIGLRATEFNAYIQDDWRIARTLTLNLGLRYELNTVPVEVNGKIADQYRFRGDHNNFAPRFGFAWRPFDGKAVVRGAYGIYYNVLELSFTGLTRFNPPLISNLVAVNPSFPDLLANARETIPSGLVIPDPSARQPYAQHFSFTVEREVFHPSATISAGYAGTTGLKLPRNSRPNGGDGLAQQLRPDQSVGVVNRLETAAQSRYDSLQASFAWQRSGLMLRSSYTYSKFLDEVSDFPTTNQQIERTLLALDESNWRLNWGISDLDVRHLGSFAYSYELPFLRRYALLGGWQLQGISMLQSGRPYTLFSGTDNRIGSNNNRILNVAGSLVRAGGDNRVAVRLAPGMTRGQITPAAGSLGNIGRNTERGDSLLQHNLSLTKNFVLTEHWRLQFRAEGYNLTNTVNYDLPDGVLTSPNFGQAISAFDSRQVQLGLRLSF